MGIIIADDHLFGVTQNSALLLFIPSKLTILSEKDYIVIVFTFSIMVITDRSIKIYPFLEEKNIESMKLSICSVVVDTVVWGGVVAALDFAVEDLVVFVVVFELVEVRCAVVDFPW